MAEHDALGQAGSAGRVGHGDHVPGRVDFRLGGVAGVIEQFRIRRAVLGAAEDEDFLDAGRFRGGQSPVEKIGNGQQEARAGILELVDQVIGRIERVDRGVDAAQPGRAEKCDPVLRHIGHEDGEHIALAETAFGEPGREPAHHYGQLGIGDLAPARPVHERLLVAQRVAMLQQHVGQAAVGNVQVRKFASENHGNVSCSL